MKSKSDFWLTLHKLAHDLSKEGDSSDECADSVCAVLKALPQPTRSVYLTNLTLVVEKLNVIASECKDEA
jgi:hypothetical protein